MKNNKSINWLALLKSISIPLIASYLGLLLYKNDLNLFENIKKPFLSPPPIVFNIVWPILYILMGISYYLVQYSSNGTTNNIDYHVHNKKHITKLYYLQLLCTIIWPIIFFKYRLYFISFLILIILVSLVVMLIFKYYTIDKKAAILQSPYILWLTFAGYLNFSIYLLNEAFI